jgi:hypothetical protein
MKMISQQTICEGIRNRLNVFGEEAKKIGIIPFLTKQIFTVVTAIVDVIILTGLEGRGNILHLSPIFLLRSETSQVTKTCEASGNIFSFYFQHDDLGGVVEGSRVGDGYRSARAGITGDIRRDRDQFGDL